MLTRGLTGPVARATAPMAALLAAVGGRSPSGALVLGYHDVLAPGTASSGLNVGADDLGRHLDDLKARGLTAVHLDVILDRLEAGSAIDGLFAVTFDDGLVGVHRWAMPVLAKRRVPATVFVVTGHLGVEPPWWPGRERTMTASELADLVAAGHRLGSHTRNHRSLVGLERSEVLEELKASRQTIGDLTGGEADVLAYPSGHHDDEVRKLARESGYRAGFTFLNGRVDPGDDRFRLPRLTMGDHHSSLRLIYHALRPSASWPDHQLDRVGP